MGLNLNASPAIVGAVAVLASGVGTITMSVIGKILADDLKESTPWICKNLLARAVRGLPENDRERFAEEWASHLATLPGTFPKLFCALDLQRAALSMRPPKHTVAESKFLAERQRVIQDLIILTENPDRLRELLRSAPNVFFRITLWFLIFLARQMTKLPNHRFSKIPRKSK
jgi:hypothetical protein